MKTLIFLIVLGMSCFKAYSNDTELFPAQSTPYRGQALVIHGLNLRPAMMGDIISELNLRGFDALLLKLRGHNDDLEEMKKVTCSDWENQVSLAFKELGELNKVKSGKVLLVGFSIGGVLPLGILMNKPEFKVNQAVLFAPALSLKTTSYFINVFKIFGDPFVVPSFSPEEYRAQEGTSMGAYRCLFQAVDKFEKGNLKTLTFPTLIFMNPHDGLVSYEGIKDISKKMGHANLVEVDTSKSSLSKPNPHLIIDKRSLGLEEWNKKIVTELDNFLSK